MHCGRAFDVIRFVREVYTSPDNLKGEVDEYFRRAVFFKSGERDEPRARFQMVQGLAIGLEEMAVRPRLDSEEWS